MFLQLEKGNQKLRIYRDGKIYFYFFGIFLLFVFISVYSSDAPDKESFFFVMLVFAPLMWLCFWVVLHGSITLDRATSMLEFSKSWNLNTPSFTVTSMNLDQIKMTCFYTPGWAICTLILCIREGSKYEENQLPFYIFDWEDCASVARMIGKFANKPAFDDDGDQIFTPKN